MSRGLPLCRRSDVSQPKHTRCNAGGPLRFQRAIVLLRARPTRSRDRPRELVPLNPVRAMEPKDTPPQNSSSEAVKGTQPGDEDCRETRMLNAHPPGTLVDQPLGTPQPSPGQEPEPYLAQPVPTPPLIVTPSSAWSAAGTPMGPPVVGAADWVTVSATDEYLRVVRSTAIFASLALVRPDEACACTREPAECVLVVLGAVDGWRGHLAPHRHAS